MAFPEHFAGFTVLPLAYTASKRHVMYLREHIAKQRGDKTESFPSGRTLFVVNIPPDATDRELSLFFKPCGVVERVAFDRDAWSPETYGPIEDDDAESTGESVDGDAADLSEPNESNRPRKKQKLSKKKQKDKAPPQVTPLPVPDLPLRTFRRSGSCAHIIFLEPSSLARALSLGSAARPRTWPPTVAAISPCGLAHYTARHSASRPSLSDIKAHADTYMEVYEYNKALSKQKSKYRKGEAIVDEDGFTLVTRGGAYGTTLGGGAGVASKKFMKDLESGQEETSGRRGKRKPKKHEKEGFYSFQRHEEQRKRLENLKANWKKDQEKVSQLAKSKRSRFKPY